MATAGPRGLPPSPSSGSAPRHLDDVLVGGPRPPWSVLLVGCVHSAFIEIGWGAVFSTADHHVYIESGRGASSSTADSSSPPPSCHIDEAGGGEEEFPLVARYATNPVVRPCDAWARIDEPGSLPDHEVSTANRPSPASSCLIVPRRDAWVRIDEPGNLPDHDSSTADCSSLASSCLIVPRRDAWDRIDEPDILPDQADQRLDTWCHMHEEGGLTLHDDDAYRLTDGDVVLTEAPDAGKLLTDDKVDDKILTDALIKGTEADLVTEGAEAGKIMTDIIGTGSGMILTDALTKGTEADVLTEGAEAGKIMTDVIGTGSGMIMTDAAAGEYIRSPPLLLRGFMEGLPKELVIRISKELVKSSIKDAIAMKLACKSWNAAFEISGPLLVVTRKDPASPAVTIFRIASQEDVLFPLALVRVDCLYPPPVHSHCWGSSKGLLALKMTTDNSITLHCPTCGFIKPLPNLPLNYDPKGLFVGAENFIISLLTDVTLQGIADDEIALDTTLIFLQQMLIDVENAADDEEFIWFWDVYPGTNQFSQVRTVNFTPNATFSAATAESVFILDRTDRLFNQPFVTVELGERFASDNFTATRMFQGQHIFVCGESAYLCILTRSMFDSSDIGAVCFHIEHNHVDLELSLVEVDSFGPYSVYLGSNHPLVLSAIDGVPGRSPNTIYIEDNDGIIRNKGW